MRDGERQEGGKREGRYREVEIYKDRERFFHSVRYSSLCVEQVIPNWGTHNVVGGMPNKNVITF